MCCMPQYIHICEYKAKLLHLSPVALQKICAVYPVPSQAPGDPFPQSSPSLVRQWWVQT